MSKIDGFEMVVMVALTVLVVICTMCIYVWKLS